MNIGKLNMARVIINDKIFVKLFEYNDIRHCQLHIYGSHYSVSKYFPEYYAQYICCNKYHLDNICQICGKWQNKKYFGLIDLDNKFLYKLNTKDPLEPQCKMELYSIITDSLSLELSKLLKIENDYLQVCDYKILKSINCQNLNCKFVIFTKFNRENYNFIPHSTSIPPNALAMNIALYHNNYRWNLQNNKLLFNVQKIIMNKTLLPLTYHFDLKTNLITINDKIVVRKFSSKISDIRQIMQIYLELYQIIIYLCLLDNGLAIELCHLIYKHCEII